MGRNVNEQEPKPLRYNFSGHPVNLEGFEVSPCVGREFPADGNELLKDIRNLLLALPQRDRLLAGEIGEVILPGLSQAAAILLAEWHGQFGNFPSIRWTVLVDGKFSYPTEATSNLNEVRRSARKARPA